MMRWMTLLSPATIALAACGVRPAAAPVPVVGEHADIAALTGQWSGRYSSTATGRRGTITFDLRAGADTAYGEVQRTFSPALRIYGESGEQVSCTSRVCAAIDIVVVGIEGGKIRGTLAPYWDPDCDCRAMTVFEGKLEGNRVAGTFTSRREVGGSPLGNGQWAAERRRR